MKNHIMLNRKYTSSNGDFFHCDVSFWGGTPLKFNMEPENQPMEKEIPFGNHHFQVSC